MCVCVRERETNRERERERVLSINGKSIQQACFRAKREPLETCWAMLSESQGQNLALTVLCVPCSLDSGAGAVRGLASIGLTILGGALTDEGVLTE